MLVQSREVEQNTRESHLRFAFPYPEGISRGDDFQAAPEPEAVISFRRAGSLRYIANRPNPLRESFFRSLGIGPGRLVGIELLHSRRVLILEEGDRDRKSVVFERDAWTLAEAERKKTREPCVGQAGLVIAQDNMSDKKREKFSVDGQADTVQGADGILCRSEYLVPSVTVADCMPIWLFDRDSGFFGVLHSGWQGTGILREAVRALEERFGSRPSSMAIILGPSIGSCCYAVPPDRAIFFAERFGPESVLEIAAGLSLDLRAANLGIARSLGIGAALSVEACTACHAGFGSYRREGSACYTRMAAACGYF